MIEIVAVEEIAAEEAARIAEIATETAIEELAAEDASQIRQHMIGEEIIRFYK